MNNTELDTKGFKVGDVVNFVVGTSLLTGKITKFYKGCFGRVECSVKTSYKAYPHILLDRLEIVNDDVEIKNNLIDQMIHELYCIDHNIIDFDFVIEFLQLHKE